MRVSVCSLAGAAAGTLSCFDSPASTAPAAGAAAEAAVVVGRLVGARSRRYSFSTSSSQRREFRPRASPEDAVSAVSLRDTWRPAALTATLDMPGPRSRDPLIVVQNR